MQPLEKLTLVTLGIVLSGLLAAKALQVSNATPHALLFGWLWFNLFIAVYEFYIVYNRSKFHPSKCPKNYWQERVRSDFWLHTWHEYTCQSDLRYLTPSSYVFSIEFTNAILVLLLWIAYLMKSSQAVTALLWLQLVVCALYFATLTRKKLNTTTSTPIKTIIYLFISAWWILVPWILLMYLNG